LFSGSCLIAGFSRVLAFKPECPTVVSFRVTESRKKKIQRINKKSRLSGGFSVVGEPSQSSFSPETPAPVSI
jgi:hypothetical protein